MNNQTEKFSYMIKDWAGNEIFGTRNGTKVELRFKTFDDAEEYLSGLLGDTYETDRQEYYIHEEVTHETNR